MPNIPKAQKSFWTLPMVLLRDKARVEANFGLFRDRCMVCAEHTIGSEIILEALDGTPR